MVTVLPPLRTMVSVRCPRSKPSASMFAPIASETRSPLSARSEMSACSAAGPSPAATSRARPRCGPGRLHLEQLEVPSAAERHELAQVQGVGVAGEAPVAAEEPGQRNVFRVEQAWVVDDDGG
jgi:hypothetical protein